MLGISTIAPPARRTLIVLAALCALAPAISARPVEPTFTYADQRELDRRVATIGHRLAVSAGDLCDEKAWLAGLALQDLSQFDAAGRPEIIRLFGLDAGPGVQAVAAGGPAERSGLRPDDILVEVDGAPPPGGTLPAQGSHERMDQLLSLIEAAFADGSAVLRVSRQGAVKDVRVAAEQGCPTRFEVANSRQRRASANGVYVRVTTALGTYVPDDAELAAVLAHELAHNILAHKRRLDAAGVSRGLLGNFGRNAALIRETEEEADRLSIYLLDRAGYDVEGAPRFWARFGSAGFNIFGSPTHGHPNSRMRQLREEIIAVRRARAAGQVPVPTFLSAAR